jgi:hypothetical protein
MTGFRFNLDRVMHWRALELASEEAKLRRLIEEEALLQSKLEGIRDALAETPVRIAAMTDIRGSDLNHVAGYTIQLTNERDRITGLCREKKRAIAEQVEVHRKAKQRLRLLEELRSRQYQEWKTRTLRELDELAHESYLARWSAV